MWRWVEQRWKQTGNHDRVELAVEKHLIRLTARRYPCDFVALRQCHFHARVRFPGVPVNVVEIDAVLMLQHAAYPHRRGLLKLGETDAFADQIFWLANAAFGV